MVRGIALFACVLFLVIHTNANANTQPSASKLKESIELSQTWLNNFQKENGLYHYIFRPAGYIQKTPAQAPEQIKQRMAPGQITQKSAPDSFAPYPDDDNIVRQILSYWALIKSTDFNDNDSVLNNIKRFEAAILKHIVIQDSAHGPALFVQYDEQMKVNSTALYLAALLAKKDRGLSLTKEQKSHIKFAVNGLKVFAAPEAGFYYYHDTNRVNFISSYGSGEAQLALAQYVNETQDATLHASIKKRFDEYFQAYYANNFTNPMSYTDTERIGYHTWALYYLNEIDKFEPINYQKYARPLIKYAFDFKEANSQCMDNPCIYSMAMWDSSSVEGLAAAYPLMLKYETDQDLIKRTKSYLDNSISYLLTLQVNSIAEYEAKTGTKFKNNPNHLIGGFCDWPSCPYMRNEVSMHVTAALMAYYNLFYR